MKKILILLLILISAICFADENIIDNKDVSQSQLLVNTFSMPNNTPVAVVNGKKITKGELMNEVWKQSAVNVLKVLINQTILEQGLAKEKISVSTKEIDEEVAKILKENNFASVDDLSKKANINVIDFYRQIRIQLCLGKYVEKKFVLDEKKLNSYMKPAHILIKFDASVQNEIEREEKCKAKIDEIYAKVKAGEDFASLAKQYSEDGSKNNGGVLGWVEESVNFVPEFKAAMLKLKTGEYSEPIKSQFGYHIIKMEQKGNTATGEDREYLIQKQKDVQFSQIVNSFYEKIQKEFNVVNYLVPVNTKQEQKEPTKKETK